MEEPMEYSMQVKRRKRCGPAHPKPIVIRCELCCESPATLTDVIVRIIKYIMCQKQQIPYAYEHLKYIASKSSDLPAVHEGRHLRKLNWKAVETFEAMERTFMHLATELKCYTNYVQEVMVLLGSTPVSPKEIYRIQLPPLLHCREHLAGNASATKTLYCFMRCIFTSEDLHKLVNKPLGLTNTYVFLKKPAGRKSDWLLPKDQYSVPNLGSQAVFNFVPPANGGPNRSAHEPIVIPADGDLLGKGNEQASPINMQWYQSGLTFRGFREQGGAVLM